jgi:hypothetical protein
VQRCVLGKIFHCCFLGSNVDARVQNSLRGLQFILDGFYADEQRKFPSMYKDPRRNALIIAISLILGLAFFLLIRQQGTVSDKQFLRSMIPHHAGAILMGQRASIQDAEIQELCKTIISSQQEEIDQMKAKLQELDQ